MHRKLASSHNLYDATKWVAQIGLPALATLYFTLAGIWYLPNAEAVVGSMAAVDTFLGVLLGVSTKMYNNSDARFDGVINVEESVSGPKVFSLELHGDPEQIVDKTHVTFKVNSGM